MPSRIALSCGNQPEAFEAFWIRLNRQPPHSMAGRDPAIQEPHG